MIWLALAVVVLAWGVWRGLCALSLAMVLTGAIHDRPSPYCDRERDGRFPL